MTFDRGPLFEYYKRVSSLAFNNLRAVCSEEEGEEEEEELYNETTTQSQYLLYYAPGTVSQHVAEPPS
jgi:hypothetical protein